MPIRDATIFEKMARTRGQKDGYVFERSGSWLGQYRVDSTEIDEKTGKPKRERVTVTIAASKGPGAVGKREARRIFRDEYLTQVNASNMRPSSAKPLRDFVESRFYPDYLPTLKPSGRTFYRAILGKHVLPILGPVKLREITVERVQALLTLKGKTLSTQTVVHIRNCLSAVLRFAKSLGWFMGELPTTGVRLPAMKREERKAPTWDQVCSLSQSLSEPCSTLVLFLTITGLRIGEAMGLIWERVNLTSQPKQMGLETLPPFSVAVRENYVNGKYGTLKTQGSVRNVPIPEWFVKQISALASNATSGAPVFVNATGSGPIDQHNLAARVLKPAAANCGLGKWVEKNGKRVPESWISWHTFRHAWATMTDSLNLTMAERMKILGHSAAAVTMGYTHPEFEAVRAKLASLPMVPDAPSEGEMATIQ
jgi:integrase